LRLVRPREERPLIPASSECFDELDSSNISLAGEQSTGSFGLESLTICVHDFEVTYNSRLITLARKVGGATSLTRPESNTFIAEYVAGLEGYTYLEGEAAR
jgi:hypothetical protein